MPVRARERVARPTAWKRATRAYFERIERPARTLAETKPAVVVLAHTASSYVAGFANEQALVDRLAALTGTTVISAAGAVRAALLHLGVKKLALATPYPDSISVLGKTWWQAAGFELVRLPAARRRHQHLRRDRGARPVARARHRRADRRRGADQ